MGTSQLTWNQWVTVDPKNLSPGCSCANLCVGRKCWWCTPHCCSRTLLLSFTSASPGLITHLHNMASFTTFELRSSEKDRPQMRIAGAAWYFQLWIAYGVECREYILNGILCLVPKRGPPRRPLRAGFDCFCAFHVSNCPSRVTNTANFAMSGNTTGWRCCDHIQSSLLQAQSWNKYYIWIGEATFAAVTFLNGTVWTMLLVLSASWNHPYILS